MIVPAERRGLLFSEAFKNDREPDRQHDADEEDQDRYGSTEGFFQHTRNRFDVFQ